MPAYIASVSELEKLGKKIIENHIPLLKLVSIAYMFRPEAAVSDDKVIAGMCLRVDDRNWALHKNDFIIEIAKDVWEEATDEFKIALMHHELCHAGIRVDEDGQPAMDEKSLRIKTFVHRHDIEDFEQILELYGAYHKPLRSFLEAFVKHKKAKKKEAEEEAADKDGQVAEEELEV